MKAVLTKIVFTLQPGEVVALRMPANQNLRVEEAFGRDVWVTHENKAGDEWLHAGGSVAVTRGEEIVVSVDPKAAGPVSLAMEAVDGHMPRKPWHVTDGWRHTLAALGWNEHVETPIVAA
ncbi:hypothetical protein ACS15_0259 [Ralstonia insidiosa]|uniref:DUF2917 domain-containing protein n=1 Tax=Ralstonia insidiosa TaxID=190721 RepID=A0AAC9BGR8_9RALS|nr:MULTISPECIES: DUF2917 domain-containing protein [Ralstonia]ANH73590.1 hypothetical protein ACS15_0259 [Ralstonia insidiosa]EPX96234.1 hypothetical protein C404_19925 [Ralstonia sp. AU12-08]MBY4707751.1 DUF2917 domain-containing protein [Ralstonia insidiosa]GAQ28904.1 hypothetical protein SAMD00023378_2587 [Ralstonia sp. NT80]